MRTYFTLLPLSLPWLTTVVSGYAIDSSCKDQAFIQTAADAAVQMAADALTAIGPEGNTNRDPNVERLIDLLFRPSAPDSPADDLLLIRRIRKVFQGVAKFGQKVDFVQPGKRESIADEVNIFCDLERVQQRPSDGVWIDTSTEMELDNYDKHDLNSCKKNSPDFAITWAPHTKADKATYVPSQVTLCPWFYQWSHSRGLTNWKDLQAKSGIAKVISPFTSKGWPFTPIDAVNMLDKVLLHEFTHTDACGGLDDVKMTKDGAFRLNKAYGWKPCMALAKQDQPYPTSPARNSDSFALFASGVRLLKKPPPGGPLYILSNGAFNGWLTGKPQNRRDVPPPELQYKQTPAAFEGFITSIRTERAAATAASKA